MSSIPKNFIDDLLNRIDIVEVIESFIRLKKQGRNYVACCPFHNEKTPSFSVSQQKQLYYCFGCGVGGNVISFLMEYDHLHFVEAIEELARRIGVDVPREQTKSKPQNPDDYHALALASQYYQQQLKQHPKAQSAVEYLKGRGVTGKTAKYFNIGFAPPGWDNLMQSHRDHATQASWRRTGLIVTNDNNKTYDRYRNRIMFPIRNRRGQTIGFGARVIDPEDKPKYLNSSESPVFHKSQTLYGIYEMLQTKQRVKQILIVEGYMDVVMLAEHGIHHAVATLGTATTSEHIQILLRICPSLVFCFDGDEAGKTAAWRALNACLPKLRHDSDVRFLFLAEGEDPDSLVQKIGREAFLEEVQSAVGLAEYFIGHLSTRHDLSNMAGKSALLNSANQLLQTMADIPLRTILMDEIAKHCHIPAERLPKLMKQAEKLSQTTRHDDLNKIPPLLRTALALLLQHPSLITLVPDNFTHPDERVWILWTEVTKTLKQHQEPNTATLLETWRDTPYYSILLQLANWQHPVPSAGIEAEFAAVISHIQGQQFDQELNNLLRQAKNQTLSQADRQRLAALIQAKKGINSEKSG